MIRYFVLSVIGVNLISRNKDPFPVKLSYRMLLLILLLFSINGTKSQETHDLVYACQSLICDPPKTCIIRDEVAQCLQIFSPTIGTTTYLFGKAEFTPESRQSSTPPFPQLFTEINTSPVPMFPNLGPASASFNFKMPTTSTASTTTPLSPLAPLLNLFGSAASITLPTLAPPIISPTSKQYDICSLPPLTGTCNRARIMWYFDTETGKCERFSYSGCGNENRFPSRIQCEKKCYRQE